MVAVTETSVTWERSNVDTTQRGATKSGLGYNTLDSIVISYRPGTQLLWQMGIVELRSSVSD